MRCLLLTCLDRVCMQEYDGYDSSLSKGAFELLISLAYLISSCIATCAGRLHSLDVTLVYI